MIIIFINTICVKHFTLLGIISIWIDSFYYFDFIIFIQLCHYQLHYRHIDSKLGLDGQSPWHYTFNIM